WADFEQYNRGRNAWATHPDAMIQKVAEANALKKAFGFSGVQLEHEYSVDARGIATPVKGGEKEVDYDELLGELVALYDHYEDARDVEHKADITDIIKTEDTSRYQSAIDLITFNMPVQ